MLTTSPAGARSGPRLTCVGSWPVPWSHAAGERRAVRGRGSETCIRDGASEGPSAPASCALGSQQATHEGPA